MQNPTGCVTTTFERERRHFSTLVRFDCEEVSRPACRAVAPIAGFREATFGEKLLEVMVDPCRVIPRSSASWRPERRPSAEMSSTIGWTVVTVCSLTHCPLIESVKYVGIVNDGCWQEADHQGERSLPRDPPRRAAKRISTGRQAATSKPRRTSSSRLRTAPGPGGPRPAGAGGARCTTPPLRRPAEQRSRRWCARNA